MAPKQIYKELEQRVKALDRESVERKRAGKVLRESEELYRLLFNSGNDAVFVHRPTEDCVPGTFIEVNDIACQKYGYTREELLNLTPADLSDPEKIGGYSSRLKKLLAKSHILFETVQITKDGERIPVEINSRLFDLNGRPTVLSIVRDLSSRKQAEEALRESEAQKRAILDASIDRIRYVDEDMRIIWANKPTAVALNMSSEDLVGKTCYRLFMDMETPCDGCPTVKARQTGQIERAVMHHSRVKGVEGESFWDVYCVPLKNDAGKNVNFLQISRNITDRKRAEEQIRALTQELMKAQENERQMLSRELHDRLAQDLSTLKIGLDTLFDNQPEAPSGMRRRVSEFSGLLQESIISVRDLAYDLRPPSLGQLSLAQTIYQYCEGFTEKTGLKVDFTSAGMVDLRLDFYTEINLYRMVQEGLNNVRKHADAGQVTIRLIASFPTIILRIEDDGKGFDVEQRMATITNEKRMGLRSMEERVSLLEGKMRIQSRPTRGTKIHVEVPCKEKTNG